MDYRQYQATPAAASTACTHTHLTAARRRPLAHTRRTMRRVNFEFIEPALSPCASAPCAPQEADSYTYQQVAAGFRGKPKTYL